MISYAVLRVVLAIAAGSALLLAGLPRWLALSMSLLVIGFFLAAPHSERYVTARKRSAMPLRRDERGQSIANRAARNGFVAVVIALGGLSIAYGSILDRPVPVTCPQCSVHL
jgi:hypothetical protein